MSEKAVEIGKARPVWRDVAFFLAVAALGYSAFVAFLYIRDPYGRSGLRPSSEVSNLPERTLSVSRAMDLQFDAAVVGNSTSIPLQPVILDALTGRRFVSLSMSGGGPLLALKSGEFFFRFHPQARVLVVAMDDGWCIKGKLEEEHPFPAWLYGSTADYVFGLFRNASIALLDLSYDPPGPARIDGYHPFDEAYRKHDGGDATLTIQRLNKAIRPTAARYAPPFIFDPPALLAEMIRAAPQSATFVLLWTPRYLTLQPVEGTTAEAADTDCKKQVARLAGPRVRVIDWSGHRPENSNPDYFYGPNHYRPHIARAIERDIADAIR